MIDYMISLKTYDHVLFSPILILSQFLYSRVLIIGKVLDFFLILKNINITSNTQINQKKKFQICLFNILVSNKSSCVSLRPFLIFKLYQLLVIMEQRACGENVKFHGQDPPLILTYSPTV